MALGKLNYVLTIYDVVSSKQIQIEIDNQNEDANYYINYVSIHHSVLHPMASNMMIDLIKNSNYTGDSMDDFIQCGNIVVLVENFNKTQSNTIFVGYIGVRNRNKSVGVVTNYNLECPTLLGQLQYQSLMNDYEDEFQFNNDGETKIQVTDLDANLIPISTLVDTIFENTLVNSPYVNKIELNIEDIDPETKVWFYADIKSKKWGSLETTLYAYQKVMYQELNGDITIANLNYNNNQAPQTFYLPESDKIIPSQFVGIIGWSETDRSGVTPTNAYATALPLPLLVPTNGNAVVNVDVSNAGNIFPRLVELYQSGYFTNTMITQVDISQGILTDPFLLALNTQYNGKPIKNKIFNVNYLNGTNQQVNMMSLYALRLLAEELTNTIVTKIQTPRLADVVSSAPEINVDLQNTPQYVTGNDVKVVLNNVAKGTEVLRPMPFNKMIQVYYDKGKSDNLFCNALTLNISVGEVTTVEYELIKPFTGVALWN